MSSATCCPLRRLNSRCNPSTRVEPGVGVVEVFEVVEPVGTGLCGSLDLFDGPLYLSSSSKTTQIESPVTTSVTNTASAAGC
jgi:hypothetical protein